MFEHEDGIEPQGQRPRAIVVVLALVVIATAGAFAILANGKEKPPKNFVAELEFDAKEVGSADAKTTDGRNKLKELVAGEDAALANQAAFKLTLQGEKGWIALLEVLPSAPEASIEYVQSVSLGAGRESAAAIAFESGSDTLREGAYLALKNYLMESTMPVDESGRPIHRNDGPRIFYALLPRVKLADEGERERLYPLLKRYMPIAQAMTYAKHESPLLRAAAASRFGFGNRPEEEAVLASLADDPDPLVRKEAKAQMRSIQITREREQKRPTDGLPHAIGNP
jgi:hypothetical protein